MKRILCGLLFLVFVFPVILSAQSQSNSYFPLEVGAEWTYTRDSNEYQFVTPDSLHRNDHVYYKVTSNQGMYVNWFREENNKVYLYDDKNNTEYLILDFNMKIGDTLKYSLPVELTVCDFGDGAIIESKTDTVTTDAGTFYNCVRIAYKKACLDGGFINAWFAKGVGRVKYLEDNIAGAKTSLLKDFTVIIADVNEHPALFRYVLYQNYPNPFNPATKITFEVPAGNDGNGQRTTLKVYSILGKEVATLINGYKQPGIYATVFNGSSLPSGVYLYQLTVGKYQETRKMLLIK